MAIVTERERDVKPDATMEERREQYQRTVDTHTRTIELVLQAVAKAGGETFFSGVRQNRIHAIAKMAVAMLSDSTVERASARATRTLVEDFTVAGQEIAEFDRTHSHGHLSRAAISKLVAFAELSGAVPVIAAYEGGLIEPSFRACYRCGHELATESARRTGRCDACAEARDARIAMARGR